MEMRGVSGTKQKLKITSFCGEDTEESDLYCWSVWHSSDALPLLISWLTCIFWSWQENKTSLVVQVRKPLLEKVCDFSNSCCHRSQLRGCKGSSAVLCCSNMCLENVLKKPPWLYFLPQSSHPLFIWTSVWLGLYTSIYIYIQRHMYIIYIFCCCCCTSFLC